MKSEAEVQAEIRLDAGALGILLWRNNRGAFTDQTGRVVRVGLGNDSPAIDKRIKSSDLIGIAQMRGPKRVIVMDANTSLGQFLAVECKEEGWKFPAAWRGRKPDDFHADELSDDKRRTLAQWRFLCIVHRAGGLAGFAQSVADFRRILQGELVLP